MLDEIALNWAADAQTLKRSVPHLRLQTLRSKVEKVSWLSPTRAVCWFERAIERAQEEYPPFLLQHRSALEDTRSSIMESVISKAIVCEDEYGVVVVMCPLLGNVSDYASDDEDEEDGDYEEEEEDDTEYCRFVTTSKQNDMEESRDAVWRVGSAKTGL